MLFTFSMEESTSSDAHKARLDAILQHGRPTHKLNGTIIDGQTWMSRDEQGRVILDKQGRPGWLKFPAELELLIQHTPVGRVTHQTPTLAQAYQALDRLESDPEWAATATEAKEELQRSIGPDPNVVVAPPPAPDLPYMPQPPDLAYKFPAFIVALVEQMGVYRTVLALAAMVGKADTEYMQEKYSAWSLALRDDSLAWLAQCG